MIFSSPPPPPMFDCLRAPYDVLKRSARVLLQTNEFSGGVGENKKRDSIYCIVKQHNNLNLQNLQTTICRKQPGHKASQCRK